MSVARSAARSPWRLSKKLQTSSQSPSSSSSSPFPSRCRQSPNANASTRSQYACFSTSARRLQDADNEPANTPAMASGNNLETDQPHTTSTEPLTPGAEVESVMNAMQRTHRPQDRIKLSIVDLAKHRGIPLPENLDDPTAPSKSAMPRNVQALFLAPLRRQPTHGIPVCNLQIRSYSVRNLEYMADFAMRAAYYLNLPAKGPVPLPRITNRWTVPRSNFIFTKRPENFERVTLRRLVQIQDGHPDSVRRWLQFIRKHTWYGVGYKADVFDFEPLETAKKMDGDEGLVTEAIESIDWNLFGRRRGFTSDEEVTAALDQLGFASPEASSKETPKSKNAPQA